MKKAQNHAPNIYDTLPMHALVSHAKNKLKISKTQIAICLQLRYFK